MNGFRTDVDRLAERAREFPGLAERAGAIARELNGVLEAAGRCWGGDDVGQSFDAVHSGRASDTLGRLASLGERLTDTGTRFAAMADGYRTADDSGARGVSTADA